MESTSLLEEFGNPLQRVERAIEALKHGNGILLMADENRENEGDLIFSAQYLTEQQMALMIRECSGIVCLCLTQERANWLELPPMVEDNRSKNQTAFTVSIEAKEGVTTGVSAKDRVTTVKTAIHFDAQPEDLARPGHVFPLVAKSNGVLSRRGHTEGTVDLMQLANLVPSGVLSELTNLDGTMAKLPETIVFAKRHKMPVLTIEDIVEYRKDITLRKKYQKPSEIVELNLA
ncbi:3,4-dihydroxy-2-butanone-4-phosphate synthase [Vibrio lentus]|uniref:3,4-dihydroxy-2-butanone-4-phosphate synthase n=1 Tax=Vibrio TaxID=662 RepID=UPI0002F2FF7B|nr:MULTISPECIES: 3,4-dihydroxy-2-butanone-4-phosphate synthase [Vibrio]OCH59956.1 3,4-dihydroxy-2-butanone-4-phosphate synthase [Vibrio lentus]PMI59536.1 3,4-dihydroxy-2-butanone-4-phosphate synthase [Vibrio lentus]